MLKEKGLSTYSQLDKASNKDLNEFQREMDRTNLPLDNIQKSIDILVEKVGSNKASYRLILIKQFMEIRKGTYFFKQKGAAEGPTSQSYHPRVPSKEVLPQATNTIGQPTPKQRTTVPKVPVQEPKGSSPTEVPLPDRIQVKIPVPLAGTTTF